VAPRPRGVVRGTTQVARAEELPAPRRVENRAE
jgi:hypothetical protein